MNENQSSPTENSQTVESLQDQLNIQQEALVKIYKSVEKTRKYMLWSGIMSLAIFVLPLIAMVVFLPKIFGVYTSSLGAVTGGESINVSSGGSPVGSLESLTKSLENLQNSGLLD